MPHINAGAAAFIMRYAPWWCAYNGICIDRRMVRYAVPLDITDTFRITCSSILENILANAGRRYKLSRGGVSVGGGGISGGGGNVHEQYQHECDLYWRELVTSWVYTHSLKSPNCVLQSYIQRVRDAMRSIPTGLQVTGFIEICGPEMRVDEPGTVDGPETCEPETCGTETRVVGYPIVDTATLERCLPNEAEVYALLLCDHTFACQLVQ